MIKISIVTVCYNSVNSIERTIRSVLNQVYSCYEYIIIDGASTDGTLEIIQKYHKLFNGKLKYYSEPDRGIYDAMNKGIKKCSGDIIGILNSDDYYEKETLEIVSKEVDDYPYQIVYGMLRKVNRGKELEIVFYNHCNLNEGMINHPACFISKKLYDAYGLYNTKYSIAADYDYMLRCYRNSEIRFKPVYRVLVNFGVHGISSYSPVSRLERVEIQYKYGLKSKKDVIVQKIKYCGSVILNDLLYRK